MEILHIENLSFKYPNSDKPAIDGVSLSIDSGEFVVICGESGCGKTTLLKMIKREITPYGQKSGDIYYKGTQLEKLSSEVSASEIGYVFQNPDNQIVTDKVWHELAFGLEGQGVPTQNIRRRVGEMASYFGMQTWFRLKTDELSGGQKQLLNLASVMIMEPNILILDEPTSQLDPIAAEDFIAKLQKINRELGLTIILVEHRLEQVFPIADKVLVMSEGKGIVYDKPENVGPALKEIDDNHRMLLGLPSPIRIYEGLEGKGTCPLTVKQARKFIVDNYKNDIHDYPEKKYEHSDKKAVEMRNVWMRYEKDRSDILRGLNLEVYDGEIYCILGGNGTGKTTTLNVMAGLKKAYRGKVLIHGKKIKEYHGNSLYRNNLALLPQNPQSVFLKPTIGKDFEEVLKAMEYKKAEQDNRIQEIAQKIGITHLLDKHPYDLSGGEQQKCAIAKMLLLKPNIFLLDEPTKGMDAHSKLVLADILRKLKSEGITIIMVTHDIEFTAVIADRCALFFDGEIISSDTPEKFFPDNTYYTTAANRISKHIYNGTVTCEEVIEMCKRNGARFV